MELRAAIVGIIADSLKREPGSITEQSRLVDIAEDSIAIFELLVRFEQLLGRTIAYDDIAHIETVGDIIDFARTLPPETITPMLAAQDEIAA